MLFLLNFLIIFGILFRSNTGFSDKTFDISCNILFWISKFCVKAFENQLLDEILVFYILMNFYSDFVSDTKT